MQFGRELATELRFHVDPDMGYPLNMAQKNSSIPSWVGLSEEDIGQIIAFYDSLTDEEWVAHDEYAYEREGYTDLIVPWELLPSIRTLVERAEDDRRIVAANDPAPKLEEPQEGNFPPGWNLERAQRVIAEIEAEMADWTEEEEAELRARMKGKTSVPVPDEIIPDIEMLLARHEAGTAATN